MMREEVIHSSEYTMAAINRFNEAFGRHDVDAVMALMTEDCIFESTSPPDGQRFEGQAAVRNFWVQFFSESPTAAFETEDTWAEGERAVVTWVYRWTNDDGSVGHVRGVDLMRVVGGKVAEKRSYVKG